MPVIYKLFTYLHFFPYVVLGYSLVGFAPVINKAVEKVFRFAKGLALDCFDEHMVFSKKDFVIMFF